MVALVVVTLVVVHNPPEPALNVCSEQERLCNCALQQRCLAASAASAASTRGRWGRAVQQGFGQHGCRPVHAIQERAWQLGCSRAFGRSSTEPGQVAANHTRQPRPRAVQAGAWPPLASSCLLPTTTITTAISSTISSTISSAVMVMLAKQRPHFWGQATALHSCMGVFGCLVYVLTEKAAKG